MIKVLMLSKGVFKKFVESVDKDANVVKVNKLEWYDQVQVDCRTGVDSRKIDNKWIFEDDNVEMRYTCKHIERSLVVTDYSDAFNDFVDSYCKVKPAKVDEAIKGQISMKI